MSNPDQPPASAAWTLRPPPFDPRPDDPDEGELEAGTSQLTRGVGGSVADAARRLEKTAPDDLRGPVQDLWLAVTGVALPPDRASLETDLTELNRALTVLRSHLGPSEYPGVAQIVAAADLVADLGRIDLDHPTDDEAGPLPFGGVTGPGRDLLSLDNRAASHATRSRAATAADRAGHHRRIAAAVRRMTPENRAILEQILVGAPLPDRALDGLPLTGLAAHLNDPILAVIAYDALQTNPAALAPMVMATPSGLLVPDRYDRSWTTPLLDDLTVDIAVDLLLYLDFLTTHPDTAAYAVVALTTAAGPARALALGITPDLATLDTLLTSLTTATAAMALPAPLVQRITRAADTLNTLTQLSRT